MAARSDPELAEKVAGAYAHIEQTSVETISAKLGGEAQDTLAGIRLVVWAIRGFSIGRLIAADPTEFEPSITMFKRLVNAGIKAGVFGPPPPGKQI
jgi:hypothetical protein